MYLLPNTHATASKKSREEYERTGAIIWDVHTDLKLVTLTFDDGPHPIYTPKILDILAKYEAKATFFVTGMQAEKYPTIIKRQAKEGHEIGNHTYSHASGENISADLLTKELEKTTQLVTTLTGKKPVLYRPVGGVYNDLIVETARESGYQVVLWSWYQDTKDWHRPKADKIAHHVITNTKPGNIVLLHDSGGNRMQTVKALDTILSHLSKNGYKCVTVSEMLYQTQSKFP
ncbi:chitooligosaccharide deacetylase [Bacillaceae bacterium SAS-127]|nr:chitooligosaccharide deacetylase [Bacillaceae bacterium SAS-127]